MTKTIKPNQPLISVVMPVYNPGAFLVDAIESILNQSYPHFEFIIIDDASTDNSWEIIRSYAKSDNRIRAYRNSVNLGVALTSNIAATKARGKYLARMDSDDVSAPYRLEKQIKYLEKHPENIIVGGQCTIINEDGYHIGLKRFPLSPHQVLLDMLFWAVPIQQGFMMVNLSKLPRHFVWYTANKTSAEEIDLFFNLSNYGKFSNLPDNLYYYRQIATSLSRRDPKATFKLTLQSRLKALKLGFTPSLKAVILNIFQIIVISLLPSRFIYDLWYFLRGVSSPSISLGGNSVNRVKSI